MNKNFYASIFVVIYGISAIWIGLIYTTKHRYENSKFFEHIKYITPLPVSINFWLLKALFFTGGLMCLIFGVYGIVRL